MKQLKDTPDISKGRFLQSMHYRGTLRLKSLSIPKNGVEFFTLFLDDVHERWLELFEKAKLHISESVNLPCSPAGYHGLLC